MANHGVCMQKSEVYLQLNYSLNFILLDWYAPGEGFKVICLKFI